MALEILGTSGRGGTTNRMGVNDDGRAMVDSQFHTGEHFASRDGLSFFANTADTAATLTISTTEGQMLYVENDSTTHHIVISNIFCGSGAAGTVAAIQRNPVVGSIGANNTHTPVNVNFASDRSATGTFYNWNETGSGMTGITAGTVLNTYILQAGMTILPIDEAIILGQDDSISITADAASGTPEFCAGIRFHYILNSKINTA